MSSDVKGVTALPVQHREVGVKPETANASSSIACGGCVSDTGDKVVLTDTAAKLRQIEESLRQMPVTDAKMVDEVRRLIAEGRYQIDPARVADKFIQIEQVLERYGK